MSASAQERVVSRRRLAAVGSLRPAIEIDADRAGAAPQAGTVSS